MAVQIATILLGTGLGVAAVLFAAPRGWFGTRHRASVGTVAEDSSSSVKFTPEPEQTSATEAVSPPTSAPASAAEVAPSPAPAAYETVQPPAQAPTPVQHASVVSFGSTTSTRAHRTYRRRTTPIRSSTSRTAHRSNVARQRRKSVG